MAKLLEGKEAKKAYEALKAVFNDPKFLISESTLRKARGYFRVDSYDWLAFEIVEKKNKWKFIVYEHVQHEGYCRVRLGLPMNS